MTDRPSTRDRGRTVGRTVGDSGGDPGGDRDRTGIVIVDHGSTRAESNEMLETFVELFRAHSDYAIVEPAHMELAEPSIATAFARCVERGATRVVVAPYFLAPGKHWNVDIPGLTAAAAANHPGIAHMVTAPIGLHPLMCQIIAQRIDHCLRHVAGEVDECDVCAGTGRCQLHAAARGADAPAPK